MKARMVDAGTKYLAMSFSSRSASEVLGRTEIFLLMIPRRHLVPASNTPDPELPVVATSRITVGNFVRTSKGSNWGDKMRERAVLSGIATITGSPGDERFSQRGMRRIRT